MNFTGIPIYDFDHTTSSKFATRTTLAFDMFTSLMVSGTKMILKF